MTKLPNMDGGSSLAAGMDTARVTYAASAAEARARADRDAAALLYLVERDALDVAEILGLVEPPAKRRAPKQAAVAATQAGPDRFCEICGNRFSPTTGGQRTCGRSCGAALGQRARKAKREAS